MSGIRDLSAACTRRSQTGAVLASVGTNITEACAKWLKMSTEPSDIKRVLGADGHTSSEQDSHDLEVIAGRSRALVSMAAYS